MTMNFVDIASWQDGINLAAIPGLDAFVVKATESTNYVNPICDRYIQSARALNLPIGVYHYAGSSSAKALGDAEAEWRFFRDNCAGYKGEAIPILDYEPFGYSNPSIAWAQAWADACHRDWGVWPVMYVPSYFVNQGGAAWRPIAANCGLWLAQDTGYYQLRMTAFSPPPTPDVADFWTLFAWQYCAQAAVGGVSPVDLDVAYVDRAGWQAYATGSTITTTPSEDNMPSAEDVARAVWEQPVDVGREDGTTQTEKAGLWAGWGNIHALTAAQRAEQILANQAAQNAKIDALTARLNSISSVTETPAPAPALTPEQLAAAQAALDALASVFNGLAGK